MGGGRQGSWRGDYHEDGEHISDVLVALPQLGQFRDGDATGFGIQETIYNGVFPELNLTKESDFDTYA
jgi:hypothetical protein